ncbi:2-dehydro-3-deoxygalactonokinase [Photobacterium satsumensis]|uniref:2-dehydro-3-deoxygalactonokinase n=1 Tax=Photobacterium satsumensis TaxID=2910239 RepID=UPI003D10D353
MMKKQLPAHWLVIDWGTTNFRAFAMGKQGDVLDKVELSLGLLQVKEGEFAIELENVLSDWLDEYKHLPIFMAGMVGSQQGWANVDYAPTSVSARQLADKAYRFELPWGATATIVPGVSHQTENGLYDVMRGEEVQLFGLAKLTGMADLVAVMPGTHSKHAVFSKGELVEFSSYMTGELFSVISKHTILGRGLPEAEPLTDDLVFLKGVSEGQGEQLTNTLFMARTHRLFDNITDAEVLDYLSGVLIGNELKALDVKQAQVYLVGGSKLCERYQLACQELGIESTYINGDECFIAGMAAIQEVMNNDN